ncbi:unnamed protein product [Urochloa humidicola]
MVVPRSHPVVWLRGEGKASHPHMVGPTKVCCSTVRQNNFSRPAPPHFLTPRRRPTPPSAAAVPGADDGAGGRSRSELDAAPATAVQSYARHREGRRAAVPRAGEGAGVGGGAEANMCRRARGEGCAGGEEEEEAGASSRRAGRWRRWGGVVVEEGGSPQLVLSCRRRAVVVVGREGRQRRVGGGGDGRD